MHELFLLTTFLCFITEGAPFAGDHTIGGDTIQTIWVDQGANYTLPCGGITVRNESVMWVHEGTKFNTFRIQRNGSIFFSNMKKSDSGVYRCKMESYPNIDFVPTNAKSSIEDPFVARVRIHVRTPPMAPKNVSVTPSTLSASVEWEIDKEENGEYKILNFQIAYRLKNATADKEWKTCLPALIDPHLRQYNIYQLRPNSTYVIKVWANNKLGSGSFFSVETRTNNDPQEIELQKNFLDGLDSFDVRIWIIAVGIVVTTLLVLGVATCCLFYKEYNMNLATDSRDIDGESIELMPNIILNPGYDFQPMELTRPDENSNDTTAMRFNNNSVIFPSRV